MLAALIEIGDKRLCMAGVINPTTEGRALEVAALILMAYGLYQNRHLTGVWLISLGFASNTFLSLIYGGQMPVIPEALEKAGLGWAIPLLAKRGDGLHVLIQRGDPLWWLGDVIPLRREVVSLGDLVIAAGLVLLVIELGLEGKRRRMSKVK